MLKINSKPNFVRSLVVGLMLYGLVFSPALVFALPSGGDVVSGTATIIEPSSANMKINQSTDKLIVNWDSFSIGVGESVQFFQPGVDSVALNRVVGLDPSVILGSLSANGQIFVVNPSGVYLGASAQVDAHGFLATTLDISNEDFLNGVYGFTQDPAKALASVVNDGMINAVSYVGLLAPSVKNRGSIVVADLGSIALGSGETVVMDFLGDGLINFVVTEAVDGVVLDKNGEVMADRINNSGLLSANGGQVLMTAQAAGEVIGSVVNHSGIIEAKTVQENDGVIILSGGDHGVVNVTGLLDASSQDTGETGGRVEISGEQVGLFDFAEVNVSGDAGGGTALIGGDYQGGGDMPTAQATYVGEDVVIDADALTLGDGGTVVVWADDVARVYGTISARGGIEGGDGGLVETSGRNSLEILNAPDVSAPNGAAGEWHIASSSIDIVDGDGRINLFEATEDDDDGHSNGEGQGHEEHGNGKGLGHEKDGNGSSVDEAFLAFGAGAELGAGLIVAALDDGATVVVSAEGSDTSDTTLSANLNVTGGGSSSLTLNAYNDVLINADITSAQALELALHADTDLDGFGDVVIAATSEISTHDGSIDIETNDFTLLSPLNSGAAGTTITFLTGDLALGILGAGESGLSNDELVFITADHLILNASADIFVQGLDFSGSNIGSFVRIDSGNDINFTLAPSIFPVLEAFAVNDINVFFDVVTESGDFIAVADSDMDGFGEFNLFTGATITSAQDIAVTVGDGTGTVNDDGTFAETRDLIINGVIVVSETGGGTGETSGTFFDSYGQGTFLSEFIQNGVSSNGC